MGSDAKRNSLGSRYVYHRDDHRIPFHEIDTFLRTTRSANPRFNRSLIHLVEQLDPRERDQILLCKRKAILFVPKTSSWGHLTAWRCKHALCPTCPTVERNVLTGHHCARFRSVEPYTDPDLRLRHIVLTLPRETHDFICRRRADALAALHDAFIELLREVYHVEPKGKRGADRIVAAEFGGDATAHIFGNDDDMLWPRPKPHLDILLSGWRRCTDKNGRPTHLEPIPDRWPGRWKETTSKRWARLAKKHLAAIGLPVDVQAEISRHEHFSISISDMLTGNKAAHKISYSVRPMIDLRRAYVLPDLRGYVPQGAQGQAALANPGIGPWLVYPDMDHQGTKFEHIVPLGIFLNIYHRVKHDFLDGTRRIRPFGHMSNNSYVRTAALAGHPPARKRTPKGDAEGFQAVRGWREVASDDGRAQFEAFEPGYDRGVA